MFCETNILFSKILFSFCFVDKLFKQLKYCSFNSVLQLKFATFKVNLFKSF